MFFYIFRILTKLLTNSKISVGLSKKGDKYGKNGDKRI